MLLAGRAPDVAEHLLGRRLGPSGTSPGDQGGGFLAHLHSLAVTMSQKSSASQPASAVSWALTPDRAPQAAIIWPERRPWEGWGDEETSAVLWAAQDHAAPTRERGL